MFDEQLPDANVNCTSKLYNEYNRYVNEVSKADMAASFECIVFLVTLCRQKSFTKILDLGSGFSSFALRYISVNENVQIWSVDDNELWLSRTIDFLRQQQVSTENVLMLDGFIAEGEDDFDLIFLDLNYVEVREKFIELVVQRCRPGGTIVFDDVHKPDYLYEVLRQGRRLGVNFFDIKALTVDGFGRFALLGVKES